MKLAILSDIHGNLPALNAVIEDAGEADGYLLAGDYCIGNPYPHECVGKIRGLSNTYAIRGNEEQYLENLIGKDPSAWTDGQMQVTYWCYRQMTEDDLRYVCSLPKALDLRLNDVRVRMAHSSLEFIEDCEFREWGTVNMVRRYRDAWIAPDVLRADMRQYLERDAHFQNVFSRLENGVYIFGHSHMQWSYGSADGKKLLLNPGSCGLPLDCVKDGVPYTILHLLDNGTAIAEERRAAFDREKHVDALRQSGQFEQANVWSRIVIQEWKTAREQTFFFLRYAEKYAAEIGDERRPFAVDTWEKAFARWKSEKVNAGEWI